MIEAPLDFGGEGKLPSDQLYCYYRPSDTPYRAPDIYQEQSSYRFWRKPGAFVLDFSFTDYAQRLPTFQTKNVREVLQSLVKERGTIHMLDVGCGLGNGLQIPRGLRDSVRRYGITASEFRDPLRRIYHRMNGTRIVRGNAEELSRYFPSNTFDLVVSNYALWHMDQKRAIPEIVRVLRPGGIAMLQGASDQVAREVPGIGYFETKVRGVSFDKAYTI